jgi:hypothetical protein
MALEEQLHQPDPELHECVRRTWQRLSASIATQFPLLAQLVDAVGHESNAVIDAPLSLFWDEVRSEPSAPASDTNEIAELLLLGLLICLLGDATAGHAAGDSSWAVNAVTLGAVDMLVAQFFVGATRVSASVSSHCARALSEALCVLPDRGFGIFRHANQRETALRTLAMGFKQAARSSVATAA